MNWYKLSQESLENKIVWAIDELWLTSGLLSGEFFELILQKYLNEGSTEEDIALPKAAQKITDQPIKAKPVGTIKFPSQIGTIAPGKKESIDDRINRIIEEKREDINFIFSAEKVASLAKISKRDVEIFCKSKGISLHDLVVERRKKVEEMIASFVKESGPDTFKNIQAVYSSFMEKTGHKIFLSYKEINIALKMKNIFVGNKQNKKNKILSAFMGFLDRNRNNRQTIQDIISSDKLPYLVDKFVAKHGPSFGYEQPPAREKLKEELMMKMQLRNRSKNYLSMEEMGGKFYNDYFSSSVISHIIYLIKEGLTDEKISQQLNLDINKVRNVAQIYHLRNSPFDIQDMGNYKIPKNPPRPPEPMKGYLGASVSNTKGNIKVSKEWLKKQPTLAKKWTENIPGGKAEGKTPNDFDKKEVERGKEVEYEHTPDPDTAREISMDHLEEHPDYYSGLKHMENLLKELEDKGKGKKNYDKTAGSPRYQGQLQGDEHQGTSDVMNERMRDNEVVEGEHVKKMRRMLTEKDWTNFNIYVNQLKQEGHSQNRINSMISRASVGIRL